MQRREKPWLFGSQLRTSKRKKSAQIESPDQALQLAQTCLGECAVDCCDLCRERGESYPENMHLIFEGPLFRKEKVIVSMDALALQAHDPETS